MVLSFLVLCFVAVGLGLTVGLLGMFLRYKAQREGCFSLMMRVAIAGQMGSLYIASTLLLVLFR